MKELTIIKQVEPVVEVNFEEVKVELTEKLNEYEKLVVTEDSLSFCKSEKKHLAGLRKKIDTYRKDIKKEMSIPIKAFEDKCKELVELVQQTEMPLQEGINVYDDKKREEKKLYAIGEISRVVNELKLNDKYAGELQLDDRYMNLTAKNKDVTVDIESRGKVLLVQQQREIEVIEAIKTTIERVNKDITQQLSMRDFLFHIKSDKSLIEIMAEIEKKAQQVREAEEEVKKQAEIKAKQEAERKAQEEIEKAKKDILKEVEEKVREEVKVEDTIKMVEEALEPQMKVEEGIKIYKYNMTIEGDKESLKELKQFMIDKGIIFEIK